MLGDILNELAQVATWLTEATVGHEAHNPDECMWAELLLYVNELSGEDDADDAAIVTFALICLLMKTNDPARAGALLVDKVRQICAAMARDRIEQRREQAMRPTGMVALLDTTPYSTPN